MEGTGLSKVVDPVRLCVAHPKRVRVRTQRKEKKTPEGTCGFPQHLSTTCMFPVGVGVLVCVHVLLASEPPQRAATLALLPVLAPLCLNCLAFLPHLSSALPSPSVCPVSTRRPRSRVLLLHRLASAANDLPNVGPAKRRRSLAGPARRPLRRWALEHAADPLASRGAAEPRAIALARGRHGGPHHHVRGGAGGSGGAGRGRGRAVFVFGRGRRVDVEVLLEVDLRACGSTAKTKEKERGECSKAVRAEGTKARPTDIYE